MQTYEITGMDCTNCALKIEKGVSKLTGVQTARVDFATNKLIIDGDVSPAEVEARVKILGYGVVTGNESAPKKPVKTGFIPESMIVESTPKKPAKTGVVDQVVDQPIEKTTPEKPVKTGGILGFWQYLCSRRATQMSLAGGAIILLALLASVLGASLTLRDGLLIIAMLIAVYPSARNGLVNLAVNRDFSIDLLMTIAAVGAVLIGQPLEGATVIFLFAIGEALEGYTADRARDSLRSLMKLAPPTAIRIDGNTEKIVPVESLLVNDIILVKPGERIAMDGIISAGESDINQAPITGESLPVYKKTGAEVYAGTINGAGLLKIRVTRLAADNTLSRIIHMVEEAQSVRAPSQKMIDQFAKVYTPAVVVLALVIAILPPLLFHAPFLDMPGEAHGWFYRALSLLVIACPCALVISAPVTVISGITAAARRGVLIKGGIHLEALAKVKAFAFDKTGTLTAGQPVVQISRSIDCPTGEACSDCDDVLALASAVEQRSTHPLAKAVVQAAEQRGLSNTYSPAESVEALAGQGVRGLVGNRLVTVGSHPLFDAEHPHNAQFCDLVSSAEAAGQTTMLLYDGERVQGFIGVADAIRTESKNVIAELKALGETPIMLTGDNATVANAVSHALGVDEVRSGLLPADKVGAIKDLIKTYGKVAMIGDGVNDTPALAAATVGIAMGGAGSAQALETADIALMADDLRGLPFAVRLSRFTRSLILQNIWISLATKLIFLVLALVGGASLWLAILADVGVSLVVTLNGMRPLRFHVE